MHNGEVETEPRETEKQKRKCFKKLNYRTFYTTKDHPAFQQRISLLHDVVKQFEDHNNKAWWADCCSTMIKNTNLDSLCHPAEKVITIKDFIERNQITSRQRLEEFLLNKLPKNQTGEFLYPEINMMHGGIMIKEE